MRFAGCFYGLALSLQAGSAAAADPRFARASAGLESAPLFFIEDRPDHYVVRVPGIAGSFTRHGFELETGTETVTAKFIGASETFEFQGLEARGGANFLLGKDPRQWRIGLPTPQKIRYLNLYPGINLIYSGAGGHLKSEFRVAPDAQFRAIRIEYSADVWIDSTGALHAGKLTEEAPSIYQEGPSGRIAVAGRYRLLGPRTAGFEVSSYDATLPLIIDPVISFATYMGGSGLGAVTGMALDSGGNVYAAGWTEALDFPLAGAEQSRNAGGVDAFVVKLNVSGNGLLYATYIGGRGDDRAAAIAVDAAGQAHVAGYTTSLNFPTVSAVRSARGGSKSAFVLQMGASGNSLVYSTYLGGATYDLATAIAVDGSGNTYIAGDTQSPDFPVIGAFQNVFGGATDAFLTKLNASGGYVFSTFLGGSADDHAGCIALDANRNIYLAGGTYSNNFPLAGAIQTAKQGGQDAFVAKFNANGSGLAYSTYLGGSGSPEQANGIAVDSAGNAYLAGVTNSLDFPTTNGAFQQVFRGVSEAFLTKISAAGDAWVYSTYLGGSDFDWGSAVGVDGGGNAYVVGYTSSGDFPQINAVQSGFGGLYDGFVSELNPAGNALVFSSWFGGSGADAANALALDAAGNIFLGGQSGSLDLPLAGPIQSSNNGVSLGWLARIGVTAPPPHLPSADSLAPPSGMGNAVIFSAQYSDTGGAGALTGVSLLINTAASTGSACYILYDPVANQLTLANDDPTTGSQIVTLGGGNQQNSQCLVNGAASSVSISGNTLTVNVSVAFQVGFGGVKTVYLYAADAVANTGWVARGTWSAVIPPPQPSADSVSPNASSGGNQTFTFAFSDTQSASNLAVMAMLFNTTSSNFMNACEIVYNRSAGTIALTRDDGLGSDIKALASQVILQNSQCQIGTVTASAVGFSQVVTVAIVFKGAFDGAKSIFLYASEAQANTGWVQLGSYFVTAPNFPVANSVTPAAGAGQAQRFTFTVSDQDGSPLLTSVAMLFASTLNNSNACSLV